MVIAQFKYHLHTPSRIMWWVASDLVEEHAFIIPLASKLLQCKCATLHHMVYTDGLDRSNKSCFHWIVVTYHVARLIVLQGLSIWAQHGATGSEWVSQLLAMMTTMSRISNYWRQCNGYLRQAFEHLVWWVKTNSAKNFGSVITWARDMIFLQKKSVICYWPDSPTYAERNKYLFSI